MTMEEFRERVCKTALNGFEPDSCFACPHGIGGICQHPEHPKHQAKIEGVERAPLEAMDHILLALSGISPDSPRYDEMLKKLKENAWKFEEGKRHDV